MYEDMVLWDFFADDSPIPMPTEIAQELAAWLGRARYYADSDTWPAGADQITISVGEAEATENADLAWVHHCLRAGIATAAFTLGTSVELETNSAAGRATVHFVGDEGGRKRFWRKMIHFGRDDLASLAHYSPHAYPSLLFAEGVLGCCDDLAGGYTASRGRVQKALAALDDWGYWAFTCPPPAIGPNEASPPDTQARPGDLLIQNRFGGFGLTTAPEKPDVRNDRICREAREIELGSRTLFCEWHVKLEPHQNRIHFHGPVPESDDKVVIGKIADHLPLPD